MQIDVFRHLTKSNVNSQTHFDIFNSFKNSVDYFLDETKTLLTLFKNLDEEFGDKKTGYEYYIRGYVLQLVAFMQRKGVLSINNSDSVLFNKLLPVINYIDENYNKKFSLDELGQLIFVDKYSLCRLFKKLTNSTVIDYVNFVKIQMVEEMLLFTEKSITEVAFLCGFNSMQHFNKVFKDYFEMSPTAFKKHLKAL
jgi:AraC-like DNA-binding protein